MGLHTTSTLLHHQHQQYNPTLDHLHHFYSARLNLLNLLEVERVVAPTLITLVMCPRQIFQLLIM